MSNSWQTKQSAFLSRRKAVSFQCFVYLNSPMHSFTFCKQGALTWDRTSLANTTESGPAILSSEVEWCRGIFSLLFHAPGYCLYCKSQSWKWKYANLNQYVKLQACYWNEKQWIHTHTHNTHAHTHIWKNGTRKYLWSDHATHLKCFQKLATKEFRQPLNTVLEWGSLWEKQDNLRHIFTKSNNSVGCTLNQILFLCDYKEILKYLGKAFFLKNKMWTIYLYLQIESLGWNRAMIREISVESKRIVTALNKSSFYPKQRK